jgi:hypothetical protein
MATLVLQTVGSVIGSFFGPVGSAIGSAIGATAGAAIDQALLSPTVKRSGPRLDNLAILSSTEGAPIPRLYGTMRLGGEIIWATALEEKVTKKKVGPKGARQTLTEYSYYANVAIGLCEGPVAHVRRVMADGKPLDMAGVVMRVYRGDEAQMPDPLILAKRGGAGAPAYRGLAYVVFERLPVEAFGNRVPQFTFEVVRPVGGIEAMLRAVTLIPGAGEFVYDDRVVKAVPRRGVTQAVNRHIPGEGSDLIAALDQLQALCPRLERVSLVVAWFGDDLRANRCTVAPRVETASKATSPAQWSVDGLTRSTARVVSPGPDGRPAYGGTPSDDSVQRAIAELTRRGLAVTLYPFVMMDIPAGNGLADPSTGAASQPAYPWRGRITVDPAPGRAGSPDLTAAASTQISAFFGSASAWSYRRMVLHYATLAEAAGGVDAFVIGSELVGLTRVRSAPGVYPAVAELRALAQGVRTVLRPGTKIVYGADWTEYGAHVLSGGAEVRFPLDPLFADPAVDAVALDWYAPLSDWRDGTAHLDAAAAESVHDLAYLDRNIAGGEGFDWFYASDADRGAQRRTPITDGAASKPWVFRQKDLLGWWQNAHRERVGGAELAASTAWVPASKPIWLLETGCPAVDKGSNQPSSFPDPKSSENALPRFSNGGSDPLIQARAIEATLVHWDASLAGHAVAANPVSPVYGGPMLDPSRIYAWAYDARPYPAFPQASDVWSDGGNWALGHWLNGRLGLPTLDRLVAAILADHGETDFDTSRLAAVVPGAVVDRPMSARDAIEPLATLFAFQATDRAGHLVFRHLGTGPAQSFEADDLAARPKAALLSRRRAQETELPRSIAVGFADPDADGRPAVALSRRLATPSRGDGRLDTALSLPRGEAQRRADSLLQDIWVARDTVSFALPPSSLALEVGDLVDLDDGERVRRHLVTRVGDADVRAVEARRIEPAVLEHQAEAAIPGGFAVPAPDVLADALLLDLPQRDDGGPVLQWLAASAAPWPGALNLWRSVDGSSFSLEAQATLPAAIGTLAEPLPPGPSGRWQRGASILVDLGGNATFDSASEEGVLGGANALALRRADGSIEVVQFRTATPEGPYRYRLSTLLRGQLGTDGRSDTIAVGADVVGLDQGLVAVATRLDDIGRLATWRVGGPSVDVGDDSVVEVATAIGATALRPYAPVGLRARRSAAGVSLGWTRRTRSGGDSWEGEVPLGEAFEAYEVDIVAGTTVKRTLTAASPGVLYAAADELADFGQVQARLTIRVAQMSAAIGRGTIREATLDV